MTERTKVTYLVVAIIIIFAVVGGLAWWQGQPKSPSTAEVPNAAVTNGNITTTNVNTTPMNQLDKLAPVPVATVETSLGTFKIQLYTTDAPELSKNFIELAKKKYYDGLTFHRIVPGFVIQGGDPSGDGTGGSSYKGEGTGLGDEQGALALTHLKGAVAWAKSSLPNSIGSQFYVVLDEVRTAQLNGGYSVFGQVVEGMDVVDNIGKVPTDADDKPTDAVTIIRVTIAE